MALRGHGQDACDARRLPSVGEVRQEECLDLLIALHSGLPGMCSIHANSAREAISKMCTLSLPAGGNVGHLMVVPYRHVADFTELSEAETVELAAYSTATLTALREVSHPQGFNIGINLGAVAGAGIAEHLHQHVVPR